MRPNFFVNTPDINPVFLQHSGRPGFRTRLVLAATLGGNYGIYNGFEICEAAAVPGKEEYLDTEKYQIRDLGHGRARQHPGRHPADQPACGASIRRCRISPISRSTTPANDNVLYYGKRTTDLSRLPAVPRQSRSARAQSFDFEVPLWEFGLPDDGLDRGRRTRSTATASPGTARCRRLQLDPHDTALRHLAAVRAGRPRDGQG